MFKLGVKCPFKAALGGLGCSVQSADAELRFPLVSSGARAGNGQFEEEKKMKIGPISRDESRSESPTTGDAPVELMRA